MSFIQNSRWGGWKYVSSSCSTETLWGLREEWHWPPSLQSSFQWSFNFSGHHQLSVCLSSCHSLYYFLSLCLSMSIYVCLSLFVCTFIQCLCYTWIQMRHFLPSGYWIGWWPSDDLCSSPFQFTTPCLSLSPRRHFCEEEGRDGYSGRDVHRRSGGERGEHGRGAIWKGSVR